MGQDVSAAAVRSDRLSQGNLQSRLHGLLLLRLLVAVFFFLLTIIVQSRRSTSMLAAELQPLYLFSTILFVVTFVAGLTLKRVRNLVAFAYQQLLFDTAAVTALIYLSGGVDSIFSLFYMPVIIAAAVLLFRKGSFWIASAASLSYGILLDLQYFGWIKPMHLVSGISTSKDSEAYFYALVMNIAVFFLTAFVTGYLAEEVQRSSREVERQQQSLSRMEALQQHIINSITSGLLTLDQQGVIVYVNPAARQILRLSDDELIGKSILDFFPDIGEILHRPVLPGVAIPGRQEIFYRLPSGEQLCLGYSLSSMQIDDPSAFQSGWILIFQDLTQIKSMEEHLRRQEQMAFAGKLAAEVVHEIKNPLASMSGAVQLLQAESTGSDLYERLTGIVSREIERINELVTNFLWLAKGAQKAMPSSVNLAESIREVLTLLKSQRKLTLSHRIKTELSFEPMAWIHPDHFRQIVWNLLINAVEAMPDGGELRIRLSQQQKGFNKPLESRLDISDNGVGISRDIKGRIFEPFFTTKEKGTGLGLSIVYQLVEQSGGRLEVVSSPGHGSTFSVFFPLTCILPLVKKV